MLINACIICVCVFSIVINAKLKIYLSRTKFRISLQKDYQVKTSYRVTRIIYFIEKRFISMPLRIVSLKDGDWAFIHWLLSPLGWGLSPKVLTSPVPPCRAGKKVESESGSWGGKLAVCKGIVHCGDGWNPLEAKRTTTWGTKSIFYREKTPGAPNREEPQNWSPSRQQICSALGQGVVFVPLWKPLLPEGLFHMELPVWQAPW